jgi:hypothetical protein
VLRQSEHAPTDDVPTSGRYELLNVFGTATGEVLYASEGERLPAAPRSYTWRLVAIADPWKWHVDVCWKPRSASRVRSLWSSRGSGEGTSRLPSWGGICCALCKDPSKPRTTMSNASRRSCTDLTLLPVAGIIGRILVRSESAHRGHSSPPRMTGRCASATKRRHKSGGSRQHCNPVQDELLFNRPQNAAHEGRQVIDPIDEVGWQRARTLVQVLAAARIRA